MHKPFCILREKFNSRELRRKTKSKTNEKHCVDENKCKIGTRVEYCCQDKNNLKSIKYKGNLLQSIRQLFRNKDAH